MKKLKSHAIDWAQIERFLASMDKKLASAHKILAFDEEACLQQAFGDVIPYTDLQGLTAPSVPCRLL